MDETQVKELLDAQKKAFEEFKTTNEEAKKEIEKHGTELGQTQEKLEKLDAAIEDLQTRMKRPGGVDNDDLEEKQKRAAEAKAFESFIRHGENKLSEEERKSLATDNDAEGGYLVVPEYANEIVKLLVEVSPVRQVATVRTISQGNSVKFPKEGSTAFATGWVGERTSRTETVAGTVAMKEIFVREMYANPYVTQGELDDAAYNVEAWLTGALSDRFAKTEGAGFIEGDNVLEPEGLLTNGDIDEVVSGDANVLTAGGVIDLVYDLPADYARAASFMLARGSVKAIRKFEDENGQYLWQPAYAAGDPPTILGHPYQEAVDMPAVAANAYPILFGDFKRGYVIVDKKQITTVRDPYSSKPYVQFYTTRRTGGGVLLAEAIRKQKVSA